MDPSELTIAGLLAAAIGVLWRWIQAAIEDLKRRTDDCEQDREQIHERLENHGRQLAVFRACPSSPCPAREGLERAETFNLHTERRQ